MTTKALVFLFAGCLTYPCVLGHCDNVEPFGTASGFRFEDVNSPDYNLGQVDYDVSAFKDVVLFLQDNDPLARDYETCTHLAEDGETPNPFYDKIEYLVTVVRKEGDTEISEQRTISCDAALVCADNPEGEFCDQILPQIKNQIGQDVPEDSTKCCSARRFRTSKDLDPVEFTLADDFRVNVKLNLEKAFGVDGAVRFAELCEELFICSQYLVYDDEYRCKQTTNRWCPAYAHRSLCFEDMYDPNNSEEIEYRNFFIAKNCWGFDSSFVDLSVKDGDQLFNPPPSTASLPSILNTLKGSVEGMCNDATNRSRERLFQTTEACKALIICENNKYGFSGTKAERDPDDATSAFNRCGRYTESQLQVQLDACESDSVASPKQSYPFTRQCPNFLQSRFTTAPPDYPNDVDDDPRYVSLILGKTGAAFDSRTDASILGSIKVALVAAKGVNLAAAAFRDIFPDELIYAWRNIIYIGTSIVVEVLEDYVTRYDFHDGNINGAEIEAIYENSRQLLDGSAALYDAVRCRDSMIQGPKWGHGCDSVDNDCDRVVDTCAEDVIPPVIDTSLTAASCASQWFGNGTEAQACVDSTIKAFDDCDPNLIISTQLESGLNCGNTSFEIVAMESRCLKETVTSFVARVDDIPPKVVCSLSNGGKELVLQTSRTGVFEDIGFSYTTAAPSDCANMHSVTVKVFASELDDFQNKKSVALCHKGDDLGRQGVYVAKALCETSSNGGCILDPAVAEEIRVYTIEVTAVDEAGNIGFDECRVTILSTTLFGKFKKGKVNPSQLAAKSTQRFLLTQYSHSYLINITQVEI